MSVYVVAGWMRSGTSMMMQCLEAGGLQVVYSELRQRAAKARFDGGGFVGNEGGYYELTHWEVNSPDFPAKYEGKAIKLVMTQLLRLPAYEPGYKVAFMRRDLEEIRQSAQALLRQRQVPAEQLSRNLELIRGILEVRRDVSAVDIEYRKVLDAPEAQLQSLVELGFPIDVSKAAAKVDPTKIRYKAEELDKGA